MWRRTVHLGMALLLLLAFGGIHAIADARSASGTAVLPVRQATLDPAFGDGGLLALPPETIETESPVFALTPKGDIVLRRDTELRLLTATGKPAALYGRQGTLVLPQPEGGVFRPSAIAIDPQNRLLVVGTSYLGRTTQVSDATGYLHEVEPASIRLVRYLPSGSLDPEFGSGGIVQTDLDLGPPRRRDGEPIIQESWVEPTGVAIDEDGRIVITGSTLIGFGDSCTHDVSSEDFDSAGFVARLADDGSLDRGFGRNGVVGGRSLDETPLRTEEIGKPVVAPSGSVTFLSTAVDSCKPRYGLSQLTADGRIRHSLGTNGAIGGYFTSLVAASDGSVVALAGEGWSGKEPWRDRVIKIRPSGKLDRSFGHRGRTLVRLGRGFDYDTGSVAVDSKGRILLTATIGNRNGRWMSLVRLSAAGRQETGFGPGGRLTTRFPSLVTPFRVDTTATASQFDRKGRLVTVHRYSTPQGSAPVLARYLFGD